MSHPTPDPALPDAANLFHLTIQESDGKTPESVVTEEKFLLLSLDPAGQRFVTEVLEQQSDLVRVVGAMPGGRPVVTVGPVVLTGGDDGTQINDLDVAGANFEDDRRGLYALDEADLFNLLCIPPFTDLDDVDAALWDEAVAVLRAPARHGDRRSSGGVERCRRRGGPHHRRGHSQSERDDLLPEDPGR